MSEEQFWHSNPTIIKVWAEAWKRQENRKNELIYAFVGNYVQSAMDSSIDRILNGKKAKSKYLEKPIKLFELTEEEKQQEQEKEQEKARQAFMMWAGQAKTKYKDK